MIFLLGYVGGRNNIYVICFTYAFDNYVQSSYIIEILIGKRKFFFFLLYMGVLEWLHIVKDFTHFQLNISGQTFNYDKCKM